MPWIFATIAVFSIFWWLNRDGNVSDSEIVPGSIVDAELHFQRGVALSSKGRDLEATDAYLRALKKAPSYTKAHYNLANSYARQLNYPEAILHYKNVLDIDSTHVSARHNLAAMYVRQLNYVQAIEEHEKVLEIDPSHMSTYYDLGYIHFLRGEYERVRVLMSEGQRRDPNDASFLRLLGLTLAKELKFKAAREKFQESVRLDTMKAATFVDLAQVCMKLRDYDAAESAARRGLSLDPHHKEGHFVLSNALRRLGRNEESQELLKEFKLLDQKLDKIEDQLRMLGNNPEDHEARAMLGLLYSEQGRYSEALEAYRIATRLAPDSLSYQNNLGNMYFRLGDNEAAVRAYEIAIKLDSSYSEAHYNLGQVYLDKQLFREAHKSFHSALKLNPQHAYANYFMGLLYARDNDFSSAVLVLEKAVAGIPSFLDARQKLAVAYLKTGQVVESKNQLKKIRELQESQHVEID